MKLHNYSLPGRHDTDIFKVMGSKVKVTDNILQKRTFPAESHQSTVRRQRPSSFLWICCFLAVAYDIVSALETLSQYVAEISHLYSLRDFWRHFGLCRAAAHSDCCFIAPFTNILTYFLT